MNRITATGREHNNDDLDDHDENSDDKFTAGNYVEYCCQIKMEDNNLDDTDDETEVDKSTPDDDAGTEEFTAGHFVDSDMDESTADAVADKFTEGNFIGEIDVNVEYDGGLDKDEADFDQEDEVDKMDVHVKNNYDHEMIEKNQNVDIKDKSNYKMTDKDEDGNLEFYWSDWSDDDTDGDDDGDGDHTAEVMESLMTTHRQDLSAIISKAEAERRRREIFHKLCGVCKEIMKYFPITDTDILAETDSDLMSQTDTDILTVIDSDYFVR